MANDVSAFVPEWWATPVLEKFRRTNLAMALIANTNYQGVVARAGDTVHVQTVGNINVLGYDRGLAITYQDMTPTDEQLTVDQKDYAAIQLDDIDAAQQNQDSLSLYTNEMGVAMAEKLDTFAFSFYTSTHASNRISNSGSAYTLSSTASDLTHPYNMLRRAGRMLTEQNVSRRGRWAIVSPYFLEILQGDTTYFINGSDLGDSFLTLATLRTDTGPVQLNATDSMEMGFVGTAAGFQIYTSNNLPEDASGTYSLFGQGRPLSFVAQLRKFESGRLERSIGEYVRALMLYGGKVFTEPSKAFGRIYHNDVAVN